MVWIRMLSGVLGAVFAGGALAAGFDCRAAAAPIERAICADAHLSAADEAMTKLYRQLRTVCRDGSEDTAAVQKRWLAELRQAYAAGKLDRAALLTGYDERTAVLGNRLAACAPPPAAGRPVEVRSVHSARLNYVLPWVVSSAPEVGRRINDSIFQRLLDSPAPADPEIEMLRLEKEAEVEGAGAGAVMRPLAAADVAVVRNDGRLLVLAISGEGCGAYCESFTDQMLFDTRSGRAVHAEDLFTDAGADALAQQLKADRLRQARRKLLLARNKSLPNDEAEQYRRCLRDWQEWAPGLWSLAVEGKGVLRFLAGSCSVHATRPWDLLDNLDVTLSLAQLRPHLNAYGRSLLLGVGDVLTPAPPVPNCAASGSAAGPAMPPQAGDVIAAAAGNEFYMLLKRSGQVWMWAWEGRGDDGVGGSIRGPIFVGEDFARIAASDDASFGITRDGRLLTWGLHLLKAIPPGSTVRNTDLVRMGDGYADMVFQFSDVVSLRRDGVLQKTSGATLADGVKQAWFAPYNRVLALKTDGSLWAFQDEKQWQIGTGFSRFAAHRVEAAFKADGSLWAWGQTRRAIGGEAGQYGDQLAEVGRGFVEVRATVNGDPLVALKADGSLWGERYRPGGGALEAVGCGYRDAMVLGGPFVLGLRNDGTLVAWGNWTANKHWQASRDLFAASPVTLGGGFVSLHSLPGHDSGFAVKADGSVWQWRLPQDGKPVRPDDRLVRVPLPTSG